MKNILLVGCGEKFGLELTKLYLEHGWTVWSMGSVIPEKCQPISISWNNLTAKDVSLIAEKLPQLDSIFFNQNYSCGPSGEQFYKESFKEEDLDVWSKAVWINNQMPVFLIKKLGNKVTNNTKVGWQLGWGSVNFSAASEGWRYAGYGIQKISNLIIMRGFAQMHPSIFYAVNPGHILPEQRKEKAKEIFDIQQNLKKEDSGRAINSNGTDYI